MNILVLNGSPKAQKSDTMHIARAFLDGMKKTSDVNEKIINIIEEDIKFCRGCFSCMNNGGTCIIKDDMKKILDLLIKSDIVIFSFPLYCYGMPAPLKNVTDRLLALSSMAMQEVDGRYEHLGQKDISNQRYVMISGCGFPGTKNNFEPAVAHFNRCFPRTDNCIVTIPESPLFNVPDAKEVTEPMLNAVRTAGSEYALTGKISGRTQKLLEIPMIPESEYVQIVNSRQK